MSETGKPRHDSGGYIPPGTVLVTLDVAECVTRAADVKAGRWRCCRTDPEHLRVAHGEKTS